MTFKLLAIFLVIIVILFAACAVFLTLFIKTKSKIMDAKEETTKQTALNKDIGVKINESQKLLQGNNIDSFNQSINILHNHSNRNLQK